MTPERFYFQRDTPEAPAASKQSEETSPSEKQKTKKEFPPFSSLIPHIDPNIPSKELKVLRMYYESQVARANSDSDRSDEIFYELLEKYEDVYTQMEEDKSQTLRTVDMYTIEKSNRELVDSDEGNYFLTEFTLLPEVQVSSQAEQEDPHAA